MRAPAARPMRTTPPAASPRSPMGTASEPRSAGICGRGSSEPSCAAAAEAGWAPSVSATTRRGREAEVYDGGVAIVQRTFADTRLVQTRYANGLTRSFTYDGERGTLSGASMSTPGSARVESTAVQYADPVCNFTDQCISAQT